MEGGGQVEGVGGGPGPCVGDGVLPCCDEEVDGDGVFEQVGDFPVGVRGVWGAEGDFRAGAQVGDVDRGRGEAGGGVLREGLEDGGEFVRAALEALAFLDGVFNELGADGEEEADGEGGAAVRGAAVFDESGGSGVVGG